MDDFRLLSRLNEETRSHHFEADGDIDRFLFRPTVTAADYRTYLSRVYGFLAPLEGALALAPDLDDELDLATRAKAALILQDLLALGMAMTEVDQLPRCQVVPTFLSTAQALGWLYVVERPMLSSAVIRGHLSTRLAVEMACASAYLACYAGQVGSRWRELGKVMDRVAYTRAIGDRVVMAAHDGFRILARWRHHDLEQASVRVAG
jgi:heme oxygenase